MAILCAFIDLIIPIANINRVYSGGFTQFKKDNERGFSGVLWHDEFLFRDGAMDPMSMDAKIEAWEKRGLQGIVVKDGTFGTAQHQGGGSGAEETREAIACNTVKNHAPWEGSSVRSSSFGP
jgi:hypothetical protein